MKKIYLLLLLTISVFIGCGREPIPEPVPEPPITPNDTTGTYPLSVESFEARLLHTAEGDLPYRMGYFNPDGLTGMPALVLYMHSANGRGSDNVSQLQQQKAVDSIYNYLVAHRMHAIFLVPQCPSDKYWAGNQEYPAYINPVKELLQLYADSTEIHHVYVSGASMGGAGTWRLLNELPNTFAAAFVASGTYHDNDPAVLASTPLYCTIGSEEEEWRINNLQSLTNHIKQNGGEVMFDILPGLNHPQTCEQSFTAERIGWVLGHERR